MSSPKRLLLENHRALIEASAISPEVAAARGYFSATRRDELRLLGFSSAQTRVPALVIPIRNAAGVIVLHQARPDAPRKNDKGKALKYETPSGSRLVLDVPPMARSALRDPTVPLVITEGSRKADAAVTVGLCCIALLGVYGWRGKSESGGTAALGCWESITLKSREVLIAFDSDVMVKPQVRDACDRLARFLESRGAIVRRVYLPAGDNGEKVGLDDFLAAGNGADDVLMLARHSRPATRASERCAAVQPYAVENGSLVWRKGTGDGTAVTPLCNFDARIVREETRDDGAEREVRYRIEGTLESGERLPAALVSSERFPSLNWVATCWGVRALVYAGQGKREHLRTAMQALSMNAARATVYAHVGWREVHGEWVYLHAGGAIGAAGMVPDVEVDLPDALARLSFPEPPLDDALRKAVRASLSLLEVATLRVTAPVHAAVVRAVIGRTDFGVHISGPTGALKSELAALAQQHFGPGFDRLHLVAWASTANALEGLAFAMKDALLVIDDFAPAGGSSDVARLHREADRLFRAQGNQAGRMRMRADGSLRPKKPPRGLILSTGEDVPAGHSVRARIVVVEVGPRDIDAKVLTAAQAAAADGLFAEAIAAFARWLAPQFEQVQREVKELAKGWRERGFAHRRTQDALGSLSAGHQVFRRFAVAVGVLTEAEADELGARVDAALYEVGAAQAELHTAEDPVPRFFELLSSALAAGDAHLEDANFAGQPAQPDQPGASSRWGWRPRAVVSGGVREGELVARGRCVGWIRDDDLYLELDSAFRVVQAVANGQGTTIPISARTLGKRLAERGVLRSFEPGRHTARPLIHGRQRRALHLPLSVLVSGLSGLTGLNGGNEVAVADTTAPDSPNSPLSPVSAGEKAEPEDGEFWL